MIKQTKQVKVSLKTHTIMMQQCPKNITFDKFIYNIISERGRK